MTHVVLCSKECLNIRAFWVPQGFLGPTRPLATEKSEAFLKQPESGAIRRHPISILIHMLTTMRSFRRLPGPSRSFLTSSAFPVFFYFSSCLLITDLLLRVVKLFTSAFLACLCWSHCVCFSSFFSYIDFFFTLSFLRPGCWHH